MRFTPHGGYGHVDPAEFRWLSSANVPTSGDWLSAHVLANPYYRSLLALRYEQQKFVKTACRYTLSSPLDRWAMLGHLVLSYSPSPRCKGDPEKGLRPHTIGFQVPK
jgi:hypothetical protein